MGGGGRDSRPRRTTHHLSPFYDLIALRSNADVRDRRLDQLLHAIEIAPRAAGQCVDASGFGGRLTPAVHPLVARDDSLLRGEIRGELLVQLAFVLVADADRDLLEAVEDIELRDSEVCETIDARCITNDDGVEPASAAGSSRRRAELVA